MATHVVSPHGDDDAPGTPAAPFRTIGRGVTALAAPGDVLLLRAGSYAENVLIAGKEGAAGAPIRIRAHGRERVSVDGAEPVDVDGRSARFRVGGNDEWRPAREEYPAAHPDEYVSRRTFPVAASRAPRHGAFLDREPYTRLITYDRLADLRADEQTFGRLPLDHPRLPLPGLPVVDKDGDPVPVQQPGGPVVAEFKRPWTYLGPGLHFADTGRVHIRLSHTVNHVPGLADYDGGTDPRQLRLAVSDFQPATLRITGCRFVELDHLAVRFGGDLTVRIEGSQDVVLDHVDVLAASGGVRFGNGNSRIVVRHCAVRGGVPSWMFRSDLKDAYRYRDGAAIEENGLARGTSQNLFFGSAGNVDVEVHHCEFVDGHDMAAFGDGMRFHHNWIHNMNDDGLVVDLTGTRRLDVSENVITQCLQALSFARTEAGSVGGERRVHHNLIDLRGPTAGIRPRPDGHLVDRDDVNQDGSAYRFGQLYKGNAPDGPLDLFHNTCLVAHQFGRAGIQHYVDDDEDSGVRRSANNVFVDVEPAPTRPGDYATAYLPRPDFRGPTDGNCYVQLGGDPNPLLRHLGHVGGAAATYPDLDAYRAGAHFEASQGAYPPGFEAASIDVDPRFRRIAPDGVPRFDDDLRLADDSPARGAGIDLADPAVGIDDPLATPPGPPDLGCYRPGRPCLHVGVDGRRRFPE